MPRKARTILCAISLALAVAQTGPAFAGCRWDWDCTSGQCHQVPICDSTIDIVPPRPPAVPPIAPPSIAPIPTPTVPPIGTSQCAPRYMCNGYGQCVWQTICE